MDQETLRLRALAAATARRLTAKKAQKIQAECKRAQDPLPKRPKRFTFSDEPNVLPPPPPLPILSEETEGVVAAEPSRKEPGPHGPHGPHWFAAAKAAEEATMAGSEGVAESYTLVEVPDEFTGLLIGKGGSGIRSLQDATGAVLCVGKLANQGFKKVCITGSPESQEAATAMISSFIAKQEENKKHYEQQVVEEVEVPQRFAGRLIGTRGEVIRQLRDSYGIRAELDDKPNEAMRKFILRGHPQHVQHAKQHVELLLLSLFRRAKIYNAPLESKYSDALSSCETQMLYSQGAAQQQEIDMLLHPWAEHFAGNLDCIMMFEKLQNLEDADIPGIGHV